MRRALHMFFSKSSLLTKSWLLNEQVDEKENFGIRTCQPKSCYLIARETKIPDYYSGHFDLHTTELTLKGPLFTEFHEPGLPASLESNVRCLQPVPLLADFLVL